MLAVSGGADSVALMRAMLRLTRQPDLIEMAHFNHEWRGDESDRDEEFVRQLGGALGVRVHVARPARLESMSTKKSEESARKARYAYFAKLAYTIGARYVVTAHTASDRVETILHNLFRGTGISGVRSLQVTRPLEEELLLVRPMLHVSRSQVEEYLDALGQPFCCDVSNTDQQYRRNFLRHGLLPSVREKYGDGVDAKLLSFSEIVSDIDTMLGSLAKDYLSQVENLSLELFPSDELSAHRFAFPSNQLLPAHWPVVRHALSLAWLEKGWSLGRMKREHWDLMREIHLRRSKSKLAIEQIGWKVQGNLPGNLQIGTSGAWIMVDANPFDKLSATR